MHLGVCKKIAGNSLHERRPMSQQEARTSGVITNEQYEVVEGKIKRRLRQTVSLRRQSTSREYKGQKIAKTEQ